MKKLASPFSRREFAAHQAIYDVRLDTDPDPEVVAIDVDPDKLDGVSTYLRLKEWFQGLQAELDHSWAILGEVYGRHPRLSKLWLMLRRVKSNLLDTSFSKRVTFVTTRAAFESGDGDFLKLLIRPLYGDVPEVGIRELIQNSVDAVRERLATTNKSKEETATNTTEALDPKWPDSDVIVSFCQRSANTLTFENGGPPNQWANWVGVRDRGVGMTPEIVRDYFLKAGATYRRSAAWLQEFADEAGRSRVLRSGRFGVGALAAFLIGDEMQVITRHFSSSGAIAFVAHLADDVVEMRKTNHPIGTTIRIRQDNLEGSPHSWYRSDWDWYRLATPKLTRLHHGENIDTDEELHETRKRRYLPQEGADLPPAWRRLKDDRFSDVQWTYLDDYASDLTCNGICVEHTRSREELKWHVLESNGKKWSELRSTERALRLRIPKLSVFDPDGHFPLNLTRTGLTTNLLPFSEALLESVIRDFLAYALVCGPTKPLRANNHAKFRRECYPGYDNDRYRIEFTPWLSLRNGFTLAQISFVQWAGIKRCVALITRRAARHFPAVKLDESTALIGFANTHKYEDHENYEWPLSRHWPRVCVPGENVNPLADDKAWVGCRLAVNRYLAEQMDRRYGGNATNPGQDEEVAYLRTTDRILRRKLENGRFVLLESSDGLLPSLEESLLPNLVQTLASRGQGKSAGLLAEWYLRSECVREPDNAIVATWRDLLGQPVIPYELEARRIVFKRAFEELEDEVMAWETTMQQGLFEDVARKVIPQGEYPNFTHGNQVKKHLRRHGINLTLSVTNVGIPWLADIKYSFSVHVVLSREQLIALNPATPTVGNPFKDGVEYDYSGMPGFDSIPELLHGSNARFSGVISPREEI